MPDGAGRSSAGEWRGGVESFAVSAAPEDAFRVGRRCSLFLSLNFALGRGRADNVFKVKVLRENQVILLIDVWVYIPSEQLSLRRFTNEATPRI
jgi:hypothetical protein